MDTASLKAYFNGKVCCLGCATKAMGMDSKVLQFMLTTGATVENLREPEPPAHVYGFLSTISFEDFVKLGTASRAVTECFAPTPAPILHPHYYQKVEIKVKCRFEDHKVKMGEIKRGQFMLLYKWDDKCMIASDVIQNFKADFKKKIKRDGLFPDLNGIDLYDSVVTICGSSGTIEIERHLRKWFLDVKKMEDWANKDTEEKLAVVSEALKLPKRVGLIHLKNMSGLGEDKFKIKFWMDFFSTCLGSLDSTIVLFEIKYREFNARQLKTKKEARKSVKIGYGSSYFNNGFWLDLSNQDWPNLLVSNDKNENPEKAAKDP